MGGVLARATSPIDHCPTVAAPATTHAASSRTTLDTAFTLLNGAPQRQAPTGGDGLGTATTHTGLMGMNPYRKQRRRPTDYVFVGAAVILAVALIAWGFFG